MNTPSEDQEFKYRRKVKGVILFVICLICYIAYKKKYCRFVLLFFLNNGVKRRSKRNTATVQLYTVLIYTINANIVKTFSLVKGFFENLE